MVVPVEDPAAFERELIESPWGFLAWFETYGWIHTKARKLEQPRANPFQARVAEAVAHCLVHGIPIRLIILKPRQKGSSTISTALLYWLSRTRAMKSIIMGGQYDQVKNLWEIMETYHVMDRYPWSNEGRITGTQGEWSNGSILGKETAGDTEAARSGTYQGIVATEAHRWPHGGKRDATAVLTGALNCVDDAAETVVILESTASGDHGTFYDYWQAGIDLDDLIAGRIPENWNGYIRIFSPWFEHADSEHHLTLAQERAVAARYTDEERAMVADYGLRPGHISWYRKTLKSKCKGKPDVMKRENPSTPEEAFHSSSNRRFNAAGLAILEARARQAQCQPGLFTPRDLVPEGDAPAFVPAPPESATFHVADIPIPGHRYIIGVDIAEGIAQTESADPDCHAVTVLRAGYFDPHRGWRPPRVVAWTPAECRWPIDILADVVFSASLYYGNCLIAPESNNDRGLILLLKQMGANLYQRHTDDEAPAGARSPKPTGKYGFRTKGGHSDNTRNWILEHLDHCIREWDTEGDGIDIPDLATVLELKTFIVDKLTGRAEAAPGKHDDRVLSLAIAKALENLATPFLARRGPAVIPHDLREHYDQESDGAGGFS